MIHDKLIDLSEIDDIGLKGKKLFENLYEINHDVDKKYNFIIIPIAIYNLIEHISAFKPLHNLGYDEPGIKLVGWLGEFECYLDIFLPPYQIIMSWDRQTARDIKINNILNGTNQKDKSVKIKGFQIP